MFRLMLLTGVIACILPTTMFAQEENQFSWPNGALAAVSLTFDDARHSQVEGGTALLDKFGAKATFYVLPGEVEQRLPGWKAAVEAGHEIGNHSMMHPCSGNFTWARDNALEGYSLDKMRSELKQANEELNRLLGVTPVSFAYPCGQTFIGRGTSTQSYVPVIAELFTTGRGWLDEAPNDPGYVDMAQITGMSMDGKSFEEVVEMLDQAREAGAWLVLAGHEMGGAPPLNTSLEMLEELIPYLQDPENGFWLDTVGEVAQYVNQYR